mgnify:CR=1 FL=1
MELFSANYEENTRALDDLLGVGRCFDMISRDLYVGGRRARMWVVDGYGDDAVIERMLSFWLPLRDVSYAQTMQQFIDRYITFNEVNAEQNVKNTVTSVFLGKMALLVEGYDECALIDAKQYPARGVEEPSSGKVLRGAHDGFIETLVANAALLRRVSATRSLRSKVTRCRTARARTWCSAIWKTRSTESCSTRCGRSLQRSMCARSR